MSNKVFLSNYVTILLVGLIMGLAFGYWAAVSLYAPSSAPAELHEHSDAAAPAQKTLYTCGMHPEVISDEPGTCPKCGMKLTPMDPDRARTILEARGEKVASTAADNKERKILYWRAPMDPSYVSDKPGKSPMGMDLVPVYEDQVKGGPTITIDPVTEQDMGVRYDVVRSGPVVKTIRTVANVQYDENSLGTVTTKVDGWVEKLYVQETGTQVHKGDPLFEFYSPQLYSAQEEYLVALSDLEKARQRNAPESVNMAQQRLTSAESRLLYFDIAQDRIDRLKAEKKISKTMTIRSQLTGIVTDKNIVEGDFLKSAMPAYKIADLSSVWVIGKVYESDLPAIHLGQEAHMTLDYLPGRTYRGRVTYLYPYLEKGTREISVRMEFHNPGYDLKPGMYATIEINSDELSREAVLVPDMAVIFTGERRLAYVMREPGKFEPRRLDLGVRTGTREWEVLSGVAPGEKVVVSGQFLLDSEARLREATLKMLNPGMTDSRDVISGSSSHVHSASMPMEATPPAPVLNDKFVCPMPSHAGILYDHPGDCPLCGMKLVPVQPWNLEQSTIEYYTCPMPEHYDVHEDHPGKCPRCGMTLIPVTSDEVSRFQKAPQDQVPMTLYTCPMPAHVDVASDRPGDCPKCGMKLVPTSSVPHGQEAERLWREAHPSKPEIEPATAERQAPAEVLYTCPMPSDADVVSDRPGDCPKCGMKLVPTSSVDHGAQAEAIWKASHPVDSATGAHAHP
ncbi:MAG: efflux RND transporter periplasmic adaptor subunit [bacterium]|nr:efflux RND transporter periplasmic adaptor subunit [bacterium]